MSADDRDDTATTTSAARGVQTERADRPRRSLARRRGRRLLVGLAAVFTVIGLVSSYQWLFGAPGVGHFRSAEGRAAYASAYETTMDQLPEPTSVHDIATDWGTVRAYEWKPAGAEDTTPVVLAPGRSTGVPMWSENLPGYLEDRRVIAFETLGDAGMSVHAAPVTSFADQAHWMHQVITSLAPGGAHLVGHSFGGAMAAAYAHQYPDHVVSLSLLEPALTFANPPADILAWSAVAFLPGIPDGLRETALGNIGGTEFDPDDPMARMIAEGAEHYSAALHTPSPLTDQQASDLTMPTYVAIASDESLAGGRAAADRARAALPDARVETWPDTTHSLPMQVAEPLEAELTRLWDDNEPS